MVKIHGEPWLVQVKGGQALGLRSLDDRMNLDVSSMGTHHPIRILESEWDVLNAPPNFVGCLQIEIRTKVAWTHLNMARGSWGFTDESYALSLWIIMDH